MTALSPVLLEKEKEAILIMFGPIWQRRFSLLDGQQGRPSINECVDFALKEKDKHANKDLVSFVEQYLSKMAKQVKMADKC